MGYEFRPEGHEHIFNGRPITGVTGAIEAICPLVDYAKSPKAAAFGRELHDLTVHIDHGDLDQYEYDPQIDPWLDGWRKLRSDKPEWFASCIACEEPMHSRKYNYGGIPDRAFLLPKKLIVLDIKSGQPRPVAKLQTAGYTNLVFENKSEVRRGTPVERLVAYITEGSYTLIPHKDPWVYDFNAFLAFLAVARWRQANGQ